MAENFQKNWRILFQEIETWTGRFYVSRYRRLKHEASCYRGKKGNSALALKISPKGAIVILYADNIFGDGFCEGSLMTLIVIWTLLGYLLVAG